MSESQKIYEKCLKILDFAPSERIDDYSKKMLKTELTKVITKNKVPLLKFRLKADGKEYESMYDILLKDDVKAIELIFEKPAKMGRWEYDLPIKRLRMLSNGLGVVNIFSPIDLTLRKWVLEDPESKKVIIRNYPIAFFQPASIKMKSLTEDLFTTSTYIPKPQSFEETFNDVKKFGIVPFQVRIIAYSREKRYAFDLDLLENCLIEDFRTNKLSYSFSIQRSPMQYYKFDKVHAMLKIPDTPKKVFEAIFESKGLSAGEIAHLFEVSLKIATNNIQSLVSKGLLEEVDYAGEKKYIASSKLLQKTENNS